MVRNPNVAYTKDGSSRQALRKICITTWPKDTSRLSLRIRADELSMVLRPIPAESPHLKGRVEGAIDFFLRTCL